MTEPSRTGALPDYAVPTGEFVREWMDDNGINAAELAVRLGVSRKHVSLLLRGQAALSHAVALQLERVTGLSARYWNNLESLYREDLARLDAEEILTSQFDRIHRFPLRYLRERKIVTAPDEDRAAVVNQVLAFFRVADVDALYELWGHGSAAYRRAAAGMARSEDMMTWLTIAENNVSPSQLPPFDRGRLRDALQELRALSVDEQDTSDDAAVSLLRETGVVLCHVPAVPGLDTKAATLWIHGHPVIQLAENHEPDRQGWFDLFHEIGHVLHHSPNNLYVKGIHGREEAEADAFASKMLGAGFYAPANQELIEV